MGERGCELLHYRSRGLQGGNSSGRGRCCRRTSTVAAAATQPTTNDSSRSSTSNDLQALRSWLASEGGYLHPSLVLVDVAPCGCRGVVAGGGPVTLADLEEGGPLVVSSAGKLNG